MSGHLIKMHKVESKDKAQSKSNEASWRAVVNRDRGRDGELFYAVRTTGIFCRPSCPSRKPKRSSVEFFDSANDAERAGYRACLRCRPAADSLVTITEEVAKHRAFLDSVSDGATAMKQLASRTGKTAAHISRVFKKVMGITPKQYLQTLKQDRLKGQLRAGTGVTPASYAAGYSSSSRLYERAAEHLGMTPAVYGRGGAGEIVEYGIANCSLGRMLVAKTDRGVCAVIFGDSPVKLLNQLKAEFSAATLTVAASSVEKTVAEIRRLIDGHPAMLEIPIDLRGTVFQRAVWAALRKIPVGETRSYAQVAKAIGKPTGARAVARACATNRVAMLVPCHRVVRGSGEISGYRWGVNRKKKLLEAEARAVLVSDKPPGSCGNEGSDKLKK